MKSIRRTLILAAMIGAPAFVDLRPVQAQTDPATVFLSLLTASRPVVTTVSTPVAQGPSRPPGNPPGRPGVSRTVPPPAP